MHFSYPVGLSPHISGEKTQLKRGYVKDPNGIRNKISSSLDKTNMVYAGKGQDKR